MDLENQVWRWARRYRWRQSVELMPFGLVVGLAAGIALALLSRLVPLLKASELAAAAAALATAGLLAGLLLPWLRHRRTSTLEWARIFDQQFCTADRLSTALELPRQHLTSLPEARLLQELQRQDAERAAADAAARTQQVLPIRLAWRTLATACALSAALGLLLVSPNSQEQVLTQRERDRALAAAQMQQLEQARQIVERSRLAPEQKARALQAIEQAQQQLRTAQSPEATLAAVNELQNQLRALHDETAQQRAEQLQRAGQSLAADDLTRPLAEALARGDLDTAADLLNNLVTRSRELSPDDLERVAQQLEALARAVAASDPELARTLRQAAQQMRRGDAQAARQALSEAAQSLQQTNQALQQQQDLERALAQVESARQAAVQRAGIANRAQAGETTTAQPGNEQASQLIGSTGQSDAPPAAILTEARGGSRSPDVGSDASIWQPQRLQEAGAPILLEDAQPAETTQGAQRSAPPASEGNAAVPYQRVYQRYAQAADEAVGSGAIPLERRELVRRYFSALDPQHPGR